MGEGRGWENGWISFPGSSLFVPVELEAKCERMHFDDIIHHMRLLGAASSSEQQLHSDEFFEAANSSNSVKDE